MIGLACLATALVFAAVKTLPFAHELYGVGFGALQWPFRALAAGLVTATLPALARVRMTMDAADLIALVSVAAAYRYARMGVDAGGANANGPSKVAPCGKGVGGVRRRREAP